MYIARLVVRNFRNFQFFDCPVQPGMTCILGENNAGKSNLLHALRLALDVALPSTYRQLTENDIHCCPGLNTAQQVVVGVELVGYAEDPNQCAMCGLWEVAENRARIVYRFRPRQSVREALERGERANGSLVVEDYVWELTGGTTTADTDPSTINWNDDCGQAIRFQDLQAFKIDFLPALRNVEDDLRQARTSPLSRLLTALDISQAEKDALVARVRTANNEIESSPTIHAAGAAVATSFADTVGEAFAIPLRLGMVAPTFHAITRSLTMLLTSGPVIDLEPARNGLGLNNILYVSMLLEYFRRRIARADTAGQLLLMEEPEAHLHPQLQRVLFSKLGESNFQCFVTTHSTHISSAAPLDSIIFLNCTGGGATTGTVATGIPGLEPRDRADLERYLDATRSTLLFARKVMLVEGPAELFLIPALVKHVMQIDLERLGISVVAIHGVHFAAYARLFRADGLRKRCAVVTDGDLIASDATPAAGEANTPDQPAQVRLEDLRGLENDYVRVFSCTTTFERALVLPGTLTMLERTCEEVGAPRICRSIQEANTNLGFFGGPPEQYLGGLDISVLNTAKRFGKARFAQVASKHAALATDLPEYIRNAVNWLLNDGLDAAAT